MKVMSTRLGRHRPYLELGCASRAGCAHGRADGPEAATRGEDGCRAFVGNEPSMHDREGFEAFLWLRKVAKEVEMVLQVKLMWKAYVIGLSTARSQRHRIQRREDEFALSVVPYFITAIA
jgi:hypothetical protein